MPIVVAFVAFACIAAAAFVGERIRSVTPAEHLTPDSREIVIAGLGLVSTLAAVVLGLLIDSAKGSYDTVASDVNQLASKLVVLDSVLAQYGPETGPTRATLRQAVRAKIRQVWPEDLPPRTGDAPPETVRQMYVEFVNLLQQLKPSTESQREARTQALQISVDLAKTYVLLQEQRRETVMMPVMAVLILWLAAIFAGFGLIAPTNRTVRRVLVLCALSVAGSIFLILELDDPLSGLIKLSSAPLQGALAQMGP